MIDDQKGKSLHDESGNLGGETYIDDDYGRANKETITVDEKEI